MKTNIRFSAAAESMSHLNMDFLTNYVDHQFQWTRVNYKSDIKNRGTTHRAISNKNYPIPSF